MVNHDSGDFPTMFEDPVAAFPENREIPYGPITVTRDEIIKFATEFDPAPFHLGEDSTDGALLDGLIASGFHTCSLTMRMMVDAYLNRSTCEGGAGAESIEWHAPVRPGDTLSGKSLIVSNRISKSRPDMSIVTFRNETRNQEGTLVLTLVQTAFFKNRED